MKKFSLLTLCIALVVAVIPTFFIKVTATDVAIEFELNEDKTEYAVKSIVNSGNTTDVEIPSTYNGLPVTAINDGAIQVSDPRINILTIPATVKYIGEVNFQANTVNYNVSVDNSMYTSEAGVIYNKDKSILYRCPSNITMTEFSVPETVKVINDYAFCGRIKKITVTIPEGVEKIGDYAFSGVRLVGCNLPDSIVEIGDFAFKEVVCSSDPFRIGPGIQKIGVAAFAGLTFSKTVINIEFNENSVFSTENDMILNNDKTELIVAFSGNYAIPETVKKIHPYAFYKIKSTSFSMPDSIEEIGDYAFSEAVLGYKEYGKRFPSSLKKIGDYAFYMADYRGPLVFGDSIEKIGAYAFYMCSELTSVTAGDSLKEIGEKAFANNQFALKSIVVPQTVITTLDALLSDNYSIKTIVLPNCITEIPNGLFSNSQELQRVTLGNSVTRIGSFAFSGCENLSFVNIPETVSEIGESAFEGCEALKEVSLSDRITKINDNMFKNSGLKEIVIPNSVTEIGSGAFYCTPLEKVLLSDSLTTISDSCFYYCYLLEYIKIPDSVTQVGNYAFDKCCSLVTVSLSENINQFGYAVFRDCEELQNITLPRVKTIPEEMFSGCIALKSFEIPEDVEEIGKKAFYSCKALEELNIPASVTIFGSDWFAGLTGLKAINFDEENTVYSSVDGVMFSKDKTQLVFYPGNLSNKRYVVPETTQKIISGAFGINPYLEEVVFQEGLIGIYDSMYGLSALKKVYIPSSVTTITNVFLKKNSYYNATVSDAVIYCEYGKCAYYTAVENGLNYVIMLDRYLLAEKNIDSIKLDKENNRLLISIDACRDLNEIMDTESGYFIEAKNTHYGYCGTGTTVEVKNYDDEVVAEYALVVKGDINGDSVCDTLDAMLLQIEMYSQSGSFSKEAFIAADFSQNNLINAADFQAITNYITEKDVS